VKVGDVVVPSSGWLSQAFYKEADFGVGIIIETTTRSMVKHGKIDDFTMHLVRWSGDGAYNTWEYDFELEVVSESK
tara:strand:- start:308 stop:535 length:228 start_codon:yes stop_codon:yes gene_type:complete